MTTSPMERFDYVEADPALGSASALPYVPITLQYGDREIKVSGLVDSGATLNVLPYDLGLQLGAAWERHTVPVRLAGNSEQPRSRDPWPDQFLHGVRYPILPFEVVF